MIEELIYTAVPTEIFIDVDYSIYRDYSKLINKLDRFQKCLKGLTPFFAVSLN